MSGASTSVPPARLRASPMDVTVTSMASPARENACRLAVTITAATLRLVTSSGSMVTSKCDSMLASDCRVAWLRGESPVPARPVTSP